MRKRRIAGQMAKARVSKLTKRGRTEPVKAEKRIQAVGGFERARAWIFVAAFLFSCLVEVGWQWREVNIVPDQIGGYRLLSTLHLGAMCFFLVALVLHFGLRLPFCLVWRSYDVEWLKKLGGYARRYSPVPPAGKFNAGQKLFTLFALVVGLIYGITGIGIHIPYKLPPDVVRGALNLHFASFIILVCGCLLYVYFFYVATPGRLALLTSGKPTERFLRMHHPHWYEELKGRLTLDAVRERLRHRQKSREEEVVEMELAEEVAEGRRGKAAESEVAKQKPQETRDQEKSTESETQQGG
ncbi:MAG: hypothetical protein DRP82_03930 [Planctomycetota bacterium]|nr:MAG: hypothetical protein DRP82_03930 [Planctomycetota bacterium]